MDYDRPYYEDINYHPTLYYVIFGADCRDLILSRERYNVDSMPADLELSLLTKEENAEQIDEIIGGTIGKILSERFSDLYRNIRQANVCSILAGTIKNDSTLDYMRNAVGITEALAEKGIGVLDLLTMNLYTPDEWKEKIFSPLASVFYHTVILHSENQDGSRWLHTRGMLKFGRPDISLENVPPEEVEKTVQLINQMIFYGAKGAFFQKTVRLHISDDICDFTPIFVNDFDNDDFNNAYYKIKWEDISFSAE